MTKHIVGSQWPPSLRRLRHLVAGIAGSNPVEGVDIYLSCLCAVLSCVGRDLCDGLVTRPEESYRLSNCV
jgi:hypothetical protein